MIEIKNPPNAGFGFAENLFVPTLHPLRDVAFPVNTNRLPRDHARETTMIDDEGLSARVSADQLGHAKVSMIQDFYMRRGKVRSEVADLLDRAIFDELAKDQVT